LLEGSSVNTAVAVTVAVVVVAVVAIAVVAIAVVAAPGVARSVLHRDAVGPVPAELLSDFEVSRAIGVSVEGVPAPCGRSRSGRWETVYHPLRGGERLLQASVLAGRAGRAALRAYRRRGRPLSHAGDRAYSGDDWVLGQRGDVVVLLRQHDPARWRVTGGLPWLLSTALNRAEPH
jgi:hypothetical protein